MTPWQRDLEARKRIREEVQGLIDRANELGERLGLQQAKVRLDGRNYNDACDAHFDLTWAASQCEDPHLKKRIEEVADSLRSLIFVD